MILCIVGKLPREVRINSFKLYYIEVRKTRRGFKILYHYYYIIITYKIEKENKKNRNSN